VDDRLRARTRVVDAVDAPKHHHHALALHHSQRRTGERAIRRAKQLRTHHAGSACQRGFVFDLHLLVGGRQPPHHRVRACVIAKDKLVIARQSFRGLRKLRDHETDLEEGRADVQARKDVRQARGVRAGTIVEGECDLAVLAPAPRHERNGRDRVTYGGLFTDLLTVTDPARHLRCLRWRSQQ